MYLSNIYDLKGTLVMIDVKWLLSVQANEETKRMNVQTINICFIYILYKHVSYHIILTKNNKMIILSSTVHKLLTRINSINKNIHHIH